MLCVFKTRVYFNGVHFPFFSFLLRLSSKNSSNSSQSYLKSDVVLAPALTFFILLIPGVQILNVFCVLGTLIGAVSAGLALKAAGADDIHNEVLQVDCERA